MRVSYSDLASRLVAHVGLYGELAERDAERLVGDIVKRVAAGVAAVFGVFLTLGSAALLVAALTWDTDMRIPAMAGVFFLFAAATVAAAIFARRGRQEPPFAHVRTELRNDMAFLKELFPGSRQENVQTEDISHARVP